MLNSLRPQMPEVEWGKRRRAVVDKIAEITQDQVEQEVYATCLLDGQYGKDRKRRIRGKARRPARESDTPLVTTADRSGGTSQVCRRQATVLGAMAKRNHGHDCSEHWTFEASVLDACRIIEVGCEPVPASRARITYGQGNTIRCFA